MKHFRLVAIFLALAMCVATLAGCNADNKTSSSSSTPTESTDTGSSSDTGDTGSSSNTGDTGSSSSSEEKHELDLSKYTTEDYGEGLKITAIEPTWDTVVIPEKINGKNVLALGDKVFDGDALATDAEGTNTNPYYTTVKAVDFEAGLTEIGKYNFYNMPLLGKVVLPSSVETIGRQCFVKCAALTEVTMPYGATLNSNYDLFASCPQLVSADVAGNLTAAVTKDAFKDANAELKITFGGTKTMWDLFTISARTAAKAVDVTCNPGKTVERDGNGTEYMLSEGCSYYIMIGFYDVVKYNGEAVTGYTIPDTFKKLPVRAIGDAVFNSDAYADDTLAAWVKNLAAIVTEKSPALTHISMLGNYNFVKLNVVQYILPDSITNETLVGCFNEVSPSIGYSGFYVLRIPKGVKVLKDCLNWTETTWFTGKLNPFLCLPDSFEKFEGRAFEYNTTPAAFFVPMEYSDSVARTKFNAIIDASEVTSAAWPAVKPLFASFVANQFIFGDGGILAGAFNITYSQVVAVL